MCLPFTSFREMAKTLPTTKEEMLQITMVKLFAFTKSSLSTFPNEMKILSAFCSFQMTEMCITGEDQDNFSKYGAHCLAICQKMKKMSQQVTLILP